MLTADTFLRWVAGGKAARSDPSRRCWTTAATLAPDASAADGLLKMGDDAAEALAITDDGTPAGGFRRSSPRRDLSPLFGDDPAALLRDPRVAASAQELRT